MKKILFPGTFDPPTLGHVEIIQRAAKLCDQLYIGVTCNQSKASLFSLEERLSFLKKAIGKMKHVEIGPFSGLVVDFAKQLEADAIVRGIRNSSDFEYEYQMACANRQMTGIETIFLTTSPGYAHLSSTLIREIAANGRLLHGFIPDSIEEEVFLRLCPEDQGRNR